VDNKSYSFTSKQGAIFEAIKFYIDLTPEDDSEAIKIQAASFHTGKRLSKIGRPTKKERRDLDDFVEDV
jgi:ribosome-associated heat shock protein Hsp15